MSIHVAPPHPVATAFAGLLAPQAPARDGLSVRLERMGVDLVLSSTGNAPAATVPAGAHSIHFAFAEDGLTADGIASCRALLAGQTGALRSLRDPVVERLSRALDDVAQDADETRAIYADAVRLALVTRILSLRGEQPTGDPLPAVEPAEEARPQRLKSGLPKWRMKRVLAYLDAQLGETVTLAGMAEAAGLSRMHFAAQFRIATGLRPHEFLLRRRIEKAQELMTSTRDPLVEIALAVGFQTQAHFTTVFRRFTGDTPYQWRAARRAAA